MSLYAPREVVIEARQNRKRDTHPANSGAAGGVRATVTTPDQARTIAQQAYVYGYPMVQAYLTMYAFSTNRGNPQYKGPFNAPLSFARVFTPADTAFVTPNSDTPYTF
jgi:hypothetical protein